MPDAQQLLNFGSDDSSGDGGGGGSGGGDDTGCTYTPTGYAQIYIPFLKQELYLIDGSVKEPTNMNCQDRYDYFIVGSESSAQGLTPAF